MPTLPTHQDPTLAAMDAALEADNSNLDIPRPYLGASQIGHPCSRSLWLSFRWAMPRFIAAAGLRRIQDGFRGEQVLIDWLRKVPDIILWTADPENQANQIAISDCGGHFRGHLDGVIQGLKQAPKTAHVWEAKVCNDAKVRKLEKLKAERGEKAALKEWDETYHAQAQVYMRGTDLTRHYLTVATPGCRDIVSCRTNYEPKAADTLVKKAEGVITADRPPFKISENPSWYQCKYCDYHALCHGSALPQVNCRTCAYSTATLNGNAEWICEHHKRPMGIAEQTTGCPHHVFHPDLLANHAEPIGANPKTGAITFRRKDGTTVEIGMGGMISRQFVAEHSPVVVAPNKETALIETLAIEVGVSVEQLEPDAMTEEVWPALYDASIRVLSSPWSGNKEQLRALILELDGDYVGLANNRVMRVA